MPCARWGTDSRHAIGIGGLVAFQHPAPCLPSRLGFYPKSDSKNAKACEPRDWQALDSLLSRPMSGQSSTRHHAEGLSSLGPTALKQAQWHWFDKPSDVPWQAWAAFPGSSAYLDRRYLTAMSGHGKVQCRLGMIKADNGPWLGGILMQAVQSESRSPADHMDVSIGVRIATAIMQPGGRPFRFRTLVAGQGLGSGQHTFLWQKEIPSSQQVHWMEQAFDQCFAHWSKACSIQ